MSSRRIKYTAYGVKIEDYELEFGIPPTRSDLDITVDLCIISKIISIFNS